MVVLGWKRDLYKESSKEATARVQVKVNESLNLSPRERKWCMSGY